jgi:transketolase
LIATGSEVDLCLDAWKKLTEQGAKVRVVSMPSWELFEKYCSDHPGYREEVLPLNVRARISVEMGSVFGWERYVGIDGAIIGMRSFGASAPFKELVKRFGFTTENVIDLAKRMLAAKK